MGGLAVCCSRACRLACPAALRPARADCNLQNRERHSYHPSSDARAEPSHRGWGAALSTRTGMPRTLFPAGTHVAVLKPRPSLFATWLLADPPPVGRTGRLKAGEGGTGTPRSTFLKQGASTPRGPLPVRGTALSSGVRRTRSIVRGCGDPRRSRGCNIGNVGERGVTRGGRVPARHPHHPVPPRF